MDDSRDNPETESETIAPVEGDQVAPDEQQSDLPSGQERPSDLPLPGSSKQQQPTIDFEQGTEWFDTASVQQVATSSPEATPATESDAGAKAESESEEAVTPAPLVTSMSPASAALYEPVNQFEPADNFDALVVPAETTAELGELPGITIERQDASAQPPVVNEPTPSDQEAVASQQALLLEPGERPSEFASTAAVGMESAVSDIADADFSSMGLAGPDDAGGKESGFPDAASFGGRAAPESAEPLLPEIAAGDATTSAMPPLVIEVVPSRWEQMLSDLADQAAERVARLTSEEIDSELNLYHHQLNAQLRALMR